MLSIIFLIKLLSERLVLISLVFEIFSLFKFVLISFLLLLISLILELLFIPLLILFLLSFESKISLISIFFKKRAISGISLFIFLI